MKLLNFDSSFNTDKNRRNIYKNTEDSMKMLSKLHNPLHCKVK
jgi:hypothetical protein